MSLQYEKAIRYNGKIMQKSKPMESFYHQVKIDPANQLIIKSEALQAEGAFHSFRNIINGFNRYEIESYAKQNGHMFNLASVCLGFLDNMADQTTVDDRDRNTQYISLKIKNAFRDKKTDMRIPLKEHPIAKKIMTPIGYNDISVQPKNMNMERFFNFIGGQGLPKTDIPKTDIMNLRRDAFSYGMYSVGHPSLQADTVEVCVNVFKNLGKLRPEEIKAQKLTKFNKPITIINNVLNTR